MHATVQRIPVTSYLALQHHDVTRGRRDNDVTVAAVTTEHDASPYIKMMRRVTLLSEGREGKVTLIFRASEDVHVTWFVRDDSGETLDGSEISGFIPIEGILLHACCYLLSNK